MPSQIKVDEIKNVAGQYEIKTNTFKGQTTAGSIAVQGEGTATTNLQQGLIKQWAKIDGQAATIDDSFNVSSLNDDNTGRYTTSFTSNMEDANFVAHSSGNGRGSDNFTYDAGVSIGTGPASGAQVSSSIGMQVSNESGTSEDITLAMVSVVR